ncbi:hypothetical protein NZZ21_001458 [Escherichia albertii]|nr:hypothetical protein [Escherichia albertii]EJI9010434.1 hypothetical protein [Escherichia albertii]EJQ6145855.1 hypothetical protein [Escherichia albertii]
MDETKQKTLSPVPFKFQLSQWVKMCISNEYGEVKARTQYMNNENQYLIHYLAANGCAMTNWFAESELIAVKDKSNQGLSIFSCAEPANHNI